MDVHFGFRDLPCGKLVARIIASDRAAPAALGFSCLGHGGRQLDALPDRYPSEPPTVAMPHDKDRHPLMGLRLIRRIVPAILQKSRGRSDVSALSVLHS